MNITKLPFNAHVGLRPCENDQGLLSLPFEKHLLNHLQTLHASAIYALAEASSGEFLLRHRTTESINGVLRRAACKYSAPATTAIYSKALTDPDVVTEAAATASKSGKASLTIYIAINDSNDRIVGRFSFDWLLIRE